MISNNLLHKFNQERTPVARQKLCHAPFVNINFEQNGNMRACCYNTTEIMGTYPETSIQDAWFGTRSETLRNFIQNNSLDGGCSSCKEQIEAGNFHGSKIIPYDKYSEKVGFFQKLLGKK